MDYEALARQFGGSVTGPAPSPAAPTQAPAAAPEADMAALAAQFGGQAEPAQPGFIGGLIESVTGRARATPETQTLPEWTTMPELNQLSVASLKSALGTLVSNPQETVQILQANFPGLQVRQDAKGNFILRSSVDQQEYAIPPGFTVGDIPRALGGLLAFTPAGRATTIPGAIGAAGLTQTAIEASQAATGGEFSPGEVALAAATGPAGQIIERVKPPVVQAVQRGVERIRGQAPAAVPPVPPVQPVVPPVAPAAAAAPPAPAAPGVSETIETITDGAPTSFTATMERADVSEVLDLARKAAGMGPGSSAAKARLVDMAQVNPEALAAAQRLGIEVPFDVLSDNPQVRSAVGLTRALVAGEAEAAWEATTRAAIQRADEISQQFDAAFIEGRPAPGMTSQRILDSLKSAQNQLQVDAKTIYDRIDGVDGGASGTVPKATIISLPNLEQTLQRVSQNVGDQGLSAQEKSLLELATQPGVTYGRLLREKSLIGKALEGKDSPYGNMAAGDLKVLYSALAQDQLDNVGNIAGDEVRRELRAANLMTAKRKALEKRIIGAFGKEIDGSVAQRMQSAITTAAKGDAAGFNRLMKVVPPDLQRETLATALASVTAGKGAGRAAGAGETVFSPAEFTKVYRGLRANPPVYAQMVKIMGPEWDRASRDLFELSRRIADAQSRIPVTGKANQILGEMAVEGLIGKVMSSGITQRVVTGVVGTAVPGGGVIAPDLVQWMSGTKGAAVQKAGKLFASPEFQELAVEAATTGTAKATSIRKTAMSKSFQQFADAARLPKDLDARMQFLQSAIQTERQFDQENQ